MLFYRPAVIALEEPMHDSHSSTSDGLWIGLCILLLLLLAVAGGFVWMQRQRAIQAALMAREQQYAAEMSRREAEMAMMAAEQARHDAAQQAATVAARESASNAGTSTLQAPVVPELYLNQDLWSHVESLTDADPEARVFTVDPETGELHFGDGEHGARPPDGAVTVSAEYRTGGGGTVTVFLPAADLQKCRVRAVRLRDGTLRLEVVDSKPAD